MIEQTFTTIKCKMCNDVCHDFDDIPKIREWVAAHLNKCDEQYFEEVMFNVELVMDQSILDFDSAKAKDEARKLAEAVEEAMLEILIIVDGHGNYENDIDRLKRIGEHADRISGAARGHI